MAFPKAVLPVESAGLRTAAVIPLDAVRERQRLTHYRERAEAVLAQNRAALDRLFESGLIFTRSGARIGRELLRAHQHLLKVADMVNRAPRENGAPLEPLIAGDALFDEIEALLEKTSAIARRNKSLFQSKPGL